MIQILELLDERRLSFSLSINRKELVLLSGLGLLCQNAGLKRDSKLVQESHKLLTSVNDQLKLESLSSATEFSNLAQMLVSLYGQRSAQAMSPPLEKPMKFPKKQMESWKQRFSNSTDQPSTQEPLSRRATISSATPAFPPGELQSPSHTSLPGSYSEPIRRHLSADEIQPSGFPGDQYLTPSNPVGSGVEVTNGGMAMSDWEYVLSDMDRGYSNIFTGIYGGKECGEDDGPFATLTAEYNNQKYAPIQVPAPSMKPEPHELSPETWSASSSSDLPPNQELANQRVLSYSEDSLGSAEEGVPFYDAQFPAEEHPHPMDPVFQGMPFATDDDVDYGLVGWDRRLAV